MKLRIIFKSQEDPNGGPQQQVFVDVHDEEGKSIRVGEWTADGEYEALDLDLDQIILDHTTVPAPEPRKPSQDDKPQDLWFSWCRGATGRWFAELHHGRVVPTAKGVQRSNPIKVPQEDRAAALNQESFIDYLIAKYPAPTA